MKDDHLVIQLSDSKSSELKSVWQSESDWSVSSSYYELFLMNSWSRVIYGKIRNAAWVYGIGVLFKSRSL